MDTNNTAKMENRTNSACRDDRQPAEGSRKRRSNSTVEDSNSGDNNVHEPSGNMDTAINTDSSNSSLESSMGNLTISSVKLRPSISLENKLENSDKTPADHMLIRQTDKDNIFLTSDNNVPKMLPCNTVTSQELFVFERKDEGLEPIDDKYELKCSFKHKHTNSYLGVSSDKVVFVPEDNMQQNGPSAGALGHRCEPVNPPSAPPHCQFFVDGKDGSIQRMRPLKCPDKSLCYHEDGYLYLAEGEHYVFAFHPLQEKVEGCPSKRLRHSSGEVTIMPGKLVDEVDSCSSEQSRNSSVQVTKKLQGPANS